jgi:hypothetical protein
MMATLNHKLSLRSSFVFALWAAMSASLLLLVARYGANAPFYDGWLMVELLDGTQRVDAAWLWESRNDHRIPIPKLALYGLYELFGWNFLSGMFANAFLMSGTALALILVAARMRGHVVYADAFFPLILTTWGHYENLLWSWQLTQVIPVVIVLTLLTRVVRSGIHLSTGEAILCGLGVLALPLCGVPGLAYVPGFALWLGAAGRRSWLSGAYPDRRIAVALWGFAGAALLMIPLYFYGLETSVGDRPTALRIASTMAAFLAQAFGVAAQTFRSPFYFFVAAIFLLAAVLVLRALRDNNPEIRSRAWAMACFAIGFGGLALSVGVARPGEVFASRYFLQAVPAVCWAYFAFELFGASQLARRAPLGLTVIALAMSGLNYKVGHDYGRDRAQRFEFFEIDLLAGMPVQELLARHQRAVYPFPESGGFHWHGGLISNFDVLRRAGIGVFGDLRSERYFLETPLDAVATLAPSGDSSSWTWTFQNGSFVAGFRMAPPQALNAANAPALTDPTKFLSDVTVLWRPAATETFTRDRRYTQWWDSGAGSVEFWVYDTVHSIRIEVNDPDGAFGPPEIVVLTPLEKQY